MAKGYATTRDEASPGAPRVTQLVTDELEHLAREGARRLIDAMLEGEVTDFLQWTR